jgi:hypothetical protein
MFGSSESWGLGSIHARGTHVPSGASVHSIESNLFRYLVDVGGAAASGVNSGYSGFKASARDRPPP